MQTEEVWHSGSTTSHSKLYPVNPGFRIITIFHLSLLFSFCFIGITMPFLWSASGARPVLTDSFVEACLCFFPLLLYLHFCPLVLQNRRIVSHLWTSCPTSVCCSRSVGDLHFGLFDQQISVLLELSRSPLLYFVFKSHSSHLPSAAALKHNFFQNFHAATWCHTKEQLQAHDQWRIPLLGCLYPIYQYLYSIISVATAASPFFFPNFLFLKNG